MTLPVEVERAWRFRFFQYARQSVAVLVGLYAAVSVKRVLPGGTAPKPFLPVGRRKQHHGRVNDIDTGANIVSKIITDTFISSFQRFLAHDNAAVVKKGNSQFALGYGLAYMAIVGKVAGYPSGKLLVF